MINKLKPKPIFAALSLTLLPVAIASAADFPTPLPQENIRVANLINTIMSYAFGLLIVLAAAFIMYAAYLYLAAGQNPDNQAKAKNFILYAVVAIVVGFVSRGLVTIVHDLLKAGG